MLCAPSRLADTQTRVCPVFLVPSTAMGVFVWYGESYILMVEQQKDDRRLLFRGKGNCCCCCVTNFSLRMRSLKSSI